jgi:hypothetical protein
LRRVTSSLDLARFFAPLRTTTTLCIGIFARLEPSEPKDPANLFGEADTEALRACFEFRTLQIACAGPGR